MSELVKDGIEKNAQQIATTSADVDKVARSVEMLSERQRETTLRMESYGKDLTAQKITSRSLVWAVTAIWTLIVIVVTLAFKKAIGW